MKIGIGSDHAGWELKQKVIEHLKSNNYEVMDYGTYSLESCDYPDFAKAVGEAVRDKVVDYGILICYTGIGMSISANKIDSVRASLVTDEECCRLTRQHNDANILCMGSINTTNYYACKFCDIFLSTEFLGGRHERRVHKVNELEKR
jgi:ribose 5-phosphate isomerase B